MNEMYTSSDDRGQYYSVEYNGGDETASFTALCVADSETRHTAAACRSFSLVDRTVRPNVF